MTTTSHAFSSPYQFEVTLDPRARVLVLLPCADLAPGVPGDLTCPIFEEELPQAPVFEPSLPKVESAEEFEEGMAPAVAPSILLLESRRD